jgi:N-acetylmuramoyl-L-alanine amidase
MWSLLLACAHPPEPPTVVHGAFHLPVAAPARWPSPAVVVTPPPPGPRDLRRIVAIDPGHGAGDNHGAISSFGAEERVHTLWFSRILERGLGGFRVHPLRTADDGPSYRSRVASAEASGAGALISIHADARGAVGQWSPRPGETWRIATSSPGFSILWSSRGPLGPRRQALARALSTHLAAAGFLPYAGDDYTGLYETDPEVPGVYRDLRGLYVLKDPTVPSVIIETHNALDPREVARWAEPGVAEAFAAAVGAGLDDWFAR